MEADEKFFGNMLRQLRVRFHYGANCIAMKGQCAKPLLRSDSHTMDCLDKHPELSDKCARPKILNEGFAPFYSGASGLAGHDEVGGASTLSFGY